MTGQKLVQQLNRQRTLCTDVLSDRKIDHTLPDHLQIIARQIMNHHMVLSLFACFLDRAVNANAADRRCVST